MKYIDYKKLEPDNPNLYDNGTPFDEPDFIYDDLVGASVPYLKDKQPVVIVLIGGQSSGKTTLGIELEDIYNYLYGLPMIDLLDKKNPQYSQGAIEFLHKLPICAMEGRPVHQWDESGKYSRKNSLSEFNKNMDEAMDVLRVHQTALILVRHDINKIPKELIDHEILGVLIRCKKRNPGSGYVEAEVYDFEQIAHLIHNMKTAIASQYVFNKLVFPNFRFRFKDLSPTRSSQLDRLSSDKKKDMWAQKDIKAQGLLTINELAEEIGKAVITVRNIIRELNIKPSLTLKKKFYYSQEDIKKIKYYSKKGK